MTRIFSYFLLLMFLISCTQDCFKEYMKYYNRNNAFFVQVNKTPEMELTMKYLPFGTLSEDLQRSEMDTYYFVVDVNTNTPEQTGLLNKAVMAADSIFYLSYGENKKIIFPDFVQPEIMGIQNRVRYLIGFSKEKIHEKNYFFIMEEVFFTKTQYAFPISIEKILSLENHYCFRYDQK